MEQITSSHMQNLVSWSHKVAKEPEKSSLSHDPSSTQSHIGDHRKIERVETRYLGTIEISALRFFYLSWKKERQGGIEIENYL